MDIHTDNTIYTWPCTWEHESGYGLLVNNKFVQTITGWDSTIHRLACTACRSWNPCGCRDVRGWKVVTRKSTGQQRSLYVGCSTSYTVINIDRAFALRITVIWDMDIVFHGCCTSPPAYWDTGYLTIVLDSVDCVILTVWRIVHSARACFTESFAYCKQYKSE